MPVALVARVFDTQANQQFERVFERFPVRIGRNPLNDLPLDRPYVSQFHAAIDIRDRQIFVKDLGSTNGTIVGSRKLSRDQECELSVSQEINIGPIRIRLDPREQVVKQPDVAPVFGPAKPVPPGAEDPLVRQIVPVIEAYRGAWSATYRVIYDHLLRLPPELRANYLKRLGLEHPMVGLEPDFQKIAQYYGVDSRMLGEIGPPQAALMALTELSRALVPGGKAPDDPAGILEFGRRLRDTLKVFLECFISLRNGYQVFQKEVLQGDHANGDADRVASANDAKVLGDVLFGPSGGPETERQLKDILVKVMSHQVALLGAVMDSVKKLLVQLAPQTIDDELDQRGKRSGLFSNKYEALWRLYEVRHGDYSGEDKQIFLLIFGPQFARAYAAGAGEDYTSSGDPGGKNPPKR